MNRVAVYKEISAGPFTILPLETNHIKINRKPGKPGIDALGYIIRDRDNKKFAYLIDAPRQLPERTYDILTREKLDCLVFDCTFEKTSFPSGHSDIEGIIAVKQRIKPSRTIASHISHRNLYHRELDSVLQKHNIETGYDGMKVEV